MLLLLLRANGVAGGDGVSKHNSNFHGIFHIEMWQKNVSGFGWPPLAAANVIPFPIQLYRSEQMRKNRTTLTKHKGGENWSDQPLAAFEWFLTFHVMDKWDQHTNGTIQRWKCVYSTTKNKARYSDSPEAAVWVMECDKKYYDEQK